MIENDRILIDFEKVPPGNSVISNGHPGMVFVFAGADQTKAVFEPAYTLQALGGAGNGTQAPDCHIAFTIGQLAHDNQE